MKNRVFAVLSFIAIALLYTSCSKDKTTNITFNLETPDQIPVEHYEIYSLVIKERYTSEKILVGQKSSIGMDLNYQSDFYSYMKDTFPGFDTTIVQGYVGVNQSKVLFAENFNVPQKEISLISIQELDFIFDNSGENNWDKFYARYPGANGILQFSRIAFNADMSQAVFEIAHTYASLGGNGSIIYLRKENNAWVIEGVVPTWIS